MNEYLLREAVPQTELWKYSSIFGAGQISSTWLARNSSIGAGIEVRFLVSDCAEQKVFSRIALFGMHNLRTQSMTAKTDESISPGVNFPPPLLFMGSIVLGVVIESAFPLPLSHLIPLPSQLPLGWFTIANGAFLLLWAMLTFARRKTAIYPNQPARELVGLGPYGFSRNPMYVALTMIAVGTAFLADNVWMLALLPLVLASLWKFVIRKEEAYLKAAFGDAYLAYQSQVRRWL